MPGLRLLTIVFCLMVSPMTIAELVNKWSAHYQVRADVVAAVIYQESKGNP